MITFLFNTGESVLDFITPVFSCSEPHVAFLILELYFFFDALDGLVNAYTDLH